MKCQLLIIVILFCFGPDPVTALYGRTNRIGSITTLPARIVPRPLYASTSFEQPSEIPSFIQEANKATVGAVKDILVLFYGERHYARFAALETIARVPYFSYTSVLHLYETLGWFRQKEYIKLHFAESWNELHHLLIMEALGGTEKFSDRFVAQHIAFFYYWLVIVVFMVNPAVAYDLNKHVETHAFQTYSAFLSEHGDALKKLPPPQVAVDYYTKDFYLFDACQNQNFEEAKTKDGRPLQCRRPVIENLYDVFVNIKLDEADHAETMGNLSREVATRQSRGEDAL